MPSVLVVDDTAVDRRLAGGILERVPELDVYYAEHGQDALMKIGNCLPDLVLTDLQMPELDGLELVNQIVGRFPDLPVVLMTAHGSENIAAQALANGAASYVPKSELAGNLVDTVNQVLAIAASETRHKRMRASIRKTNLEFELENDPELIPPILDLVQQLLVNHDGLDHTSRVRVGVAIEHALMNAMIRGNLELGRDKAPVAQVPEIKRRRSDPAFAGRRVHFSLQIDPEQVRAVIRDEGRGFDTSTVPQPGAVETFQGGYGRGLVLIRNFMDEVTFADGGREITLVKRVKHNQ